MSNTYPFYWVDAFTAQPFRGNPAAVVPLDAWIDDALMQRMAMQHNLAETAFCVRRPEAGPGCYGLRWFTPGAEVDLCGHATLGTAAVLWGERGETAEVLRFATRSGELRVKRGDAGRMVMDFPATPPVLAGENRSDEADEQAGLGEILSALRASSSSVLAWGRTPFDVFVVLDSQEAVQTLQPDLPAVAALGGRGVIVTAPAGEGSQWDFVSRFFAPQVGVPEDPVTGSAHCALAPYWAGRLGRKSLRARQLSPRGGDVWCEVAGERVFLGGHASLYLRGTIDLPAGT